MPTDMNKIFLDNARTIMVQINAASKLGGMFGGNIKSHEEVVAVLYELSKHGTWLALWRDVTPLTYHCEDDSRSSVSQYSFGLNGSLMVSDDREGDKKTGAS